MVVSVYIAWMWSKRSREERRKVRRVMGVLIVLFLKCIPVRSYRGSENTT